MAFPGDHYTNVHVYPINGGGSLNNSTGASLNNTLSCGQFDKSDLPSTDKKFHYKITAKHSNGKSYESAPMQCRHAGATSDFKAHGRAATPAPIQIYRGAERHPFAAHLGFTRS